MLELIGKKEKNIFRNLSVISQKNDYKSEKQHCNLLAKMDC
jgi:hypothetical protein